MKLTTLGWAVVSGTPRTQSGSIVEEQAGAWELRTKAIPGPCISYLSHQRPASDARHSRQGETSHCVAVSGADLVFSSLDFETSLFLNRP